jgi:peptidoglycan/LPS O-acetylase OafA/YrhL
MPLVGFDESGGASLRSLGVFGVLLFFVHTSLVLMASLERLEAREGGSLWHLAAVFWIRRAFRIYPLSIVAVIVFALLFAEPWRIVWPNLLLIQPFVGVGSIPGPLWSLPYEVLMYLLLPGIFLVTRRTGPKPIILVWPLLFAVIFAQKRYPEIPLFLSFVPAFMAGVITSVTPRRPRWPAWTLPVFLFSALACDMILYRRFGGQTAAGVPFCLLLGLLLPNLRELQWKPATRVFSTIAKYSYGIYLFHTISFGVFMLEGNIGPLVRLPVPPLVNLFIAIIAALIVSVISYWVLEEPMIKVGARLSSSLYHRRADGGTFPQGGR